MAFCPNCGAQAAGAFCPNCGTSVAGTTAGPAAAGAGAAGASYSTVPPPPIAQAPGLDQNLASALCYLAGLITGILFLVLAPYNQNKTIRFHAFQSIFFNIAWIVFWIVWGFISVMMHGLGFLLSPLIGLAFFVIWLYLMYSAYTNKMVKLPVIGDLAAKQA